MGNYCISVCPSIKTLFSPQILLLERTWEKEFAFSVSKLNDDIFIIQRHHFSLSKTLVDYSVANLQTFPKQGGFFVRQAF